ncbi:MAG TPA: RNA polymerase sigma-70 factor [Gammaproteobacteria bacterium]|nr:RNA polymerase sigma-70 factor [Gammaproteobacteria bacterium]
MPSPAESFLTHKPRLFGLAYRMLGSRADAEDVLQDAYLRWQEARRDEIKSPEAWLVTVVTRLSIDRLRDAKKEREAYTGPWLPEPLVAEEPASSESPERAVELAGDVSMAFLMVLERLAPEERAVFLLREVFDMDYPEVARMLGKSEAACRQLLHRAKERVREGKPRFQVNPAAHRRLLERFVAATGSGKREDMLALFAKDVRFSGDGGGKVPSALRVLEGAERVVRFYTAIRRFASVRSFTYRHAEINGEPGLLRFLDGELDAAITLVTDGVHILEIYTVRNPDKLRRIHVS